MKMLNKMCLMALLAAVLTTFCGCEVQSSVDKDQRIKQEQMLQESNRQIGMPNITRFSQKKQLKLIQEECDKEDLILYAYLHSEYTGKLVFIGKCIGYGVPYAAQFTNPEKLVWGDRFETPTLPQADPNGLFMPTSADATWLMLVDPTTSIPRVCYFEPRVVVLPFPAPVSAVQN
jgi:hypothetical protein